MTYKGRVQRRSQARSAVAATADTLRTIGAADLHHPHLRCVVPGGGAALAVTAPVNHLYREVQTTDGGRWDTSSLLTSLER